MNAISINHISKKYKGKTPVDALCDVSFEIGKGEIFGLIGPDGGGKTSLFRIISTLLLADKGMINLSGLDIVKDYEKVRQIIGYMPERFSLYPDLTVNENLNFFAHVFGANIKQNYHIIGSIYSQLEPFKDRKAGKLSGGMKQKLALCCALIHKPEILLLDEPTTGVDPVSRNEFWEMLGQLRSYGITIMVSTPYMKETAMCDRIAFIQNGKILSVNTPVKVVCDYPDKLYALKSENNYKLMQVLRGQYNVEQCYISGEYIHVVFKENNSKVDYPVTEIRVIKPTMEDCFIQLIRHEND